MPKNGINNHQIFRDDKGNKMDIVAGFRYNITAKSVCWKITMINAAGAGQSDQMGRKPLRRRFIRED
jgi:hypothetical protein